MPTKSGTIYFAVYDQGYFAAGRDYYAGVKRSCSTNLPSYF
jgi:hypothetical protein